VATKRVEVQSLRPRAADLRARAADAPPPRDFHGALAGGDAVSLIAEVKRRSPGAGAIRPDLDPLELARSYESAGASALSVLTDREYFGGSLDDLARVREAVCLPLLRKDFTLDPLQVHEARAGGADAILLIVRILDDGPLRELRHLAEELGMAALIEAHDGDEVERALASGARILGVNNRDLSTFETHLETTLGLLERVPTGVTLVSESGIRSGDDVARLGKAGVDAVLVGEALLRAEDPGDAARRMCGRPRRERAEEGPGR
jgi:indole-3-glycerol phosphate synthase